MKNKPPKLCVLEKGKIIDAQSGFVDTFNWMADVLDRLSKSGLSVVVGSEYSKKTHKLKNKVVKLKDLILGSESKTDETVFTATPISGD